MATTLRVSKTVAADTESLMMPTAMQEVLEAVAMSLGSVLGILEYFKLICVYGTVERFIIKEHAKTLEHFENIYILVSRRAQ